MLRSRRVRLVAAAACVWILPSVEASALPLHDMPDFENRPGPELFEIYNLLAETSFASNSDLLPLLIHEDETWVLGSASGVVLMGSDLGMANMNGFGFYTDVAPGGQGQDLNEIFNMIGPLGVAGPGFEAAFFGFEGEVGFFLDAWGLNDDLWHSQSDLDANETWFDHMVSYELPDGILLETTQGLVQIDAGALIGWEDLDDDHPFLDGDYNDLMLVVGTLTIVPEPGTAALLLAGLLVLASAVRLRRV